VGSSCPEKGTTEKSHGFIRNVGLMGTMKKRNTRVFQNQATTSTMLVSQIREEAALWCIAGAKELCNIMPREYALFYLLLALAKRRFVRIYRTP
jgi:hypothetical protein